MLQDKKLNQALSICLFLLRLGCFVVLLFWALDKLINPEHAAVVFSKFYKADLNRNIVQMLGGIQFIIILAFGIGLFKNASYPLVFLMHLVSTVSSYKQFINPWEGSNLLFFTAFPMLSALVTLLWLKKYDLFISLDDAFSKDKNE